MTRPKDLSIPQTPDRVDRSEQALGLDLGPAGARREVWKELAETDIKLHQTPEGSYTYVAGRLIQDDRLRTLALDAMREVRSRCREEDGRHYYAALPRCEFDPQVFEDRVRDFARGFKGRFMLANRQELLLRAAWMSPEQYDTAFDRFVAVMNGSDHIRPDRRRSPLSLLFLATPSRTIAEFEMPARGVLSGHLVHETRMGDLAELLAVAGGLCADAHPEAERACAFVRLASKAPPLVVHNADGPHLVFLCAD